MINGLRNRIKEIIPASLYTFLRAQKHKLNLLRLYRLQAKRYIAYSAMGNRESIEQLSALLIFYSHRIEKGLSHHCFRPCFGKRNLLQLGACIHVWIDRGYSLDVFEFRLALSAIRAYRDKHNGLGYSLPSEYASAFEDIRVLIDNADRELSGVVSVVSAEARVGSFSDILKRRHSIREYAPGMPERNAIIEAINLAMTAPSVCNRQSQRVVLVDSFSAIQEILDAQGGWRGYKYPPVLLIVTSSLASFVNSSERNEPYVDGGIFTMALLGSLEWEGLAACPLNAMFEVENENRIRELAHIPNGEVLISVVALGLKQKTTYCPKSARKTAEDVIRYV